MSCGRASGYDEICSKKPSPMNWNSGYGNGWPTEQLKGKNVVIIAGGTGVSPVKSLINL